MGDVCEMCGNEKLPTVSVCKFCGTRHKKNISAGPIFLHRVVNIEFGRPILADALSKLERELERANSKGITVLTVIHGYGSSGKGGIIRQECRKTLEYLESKGKIKTFIIGEKFSKKDGHTKMLLRRFPSLASNENLNKGNRGVTLVVVK